MFESSTLSDRTVETIADNVRELCRLDPSYVLVFLRSGMKLIYCRMFLSRTVAGEICMEARHNEVGYSALKLLANSGDLLFELPCVLI